MLKKPLIVIGGPTACGKTKSSIALAKAVNGEIISADSMQIYKYMDIGTAKVLPAEMEGIPHYLIDELNPDEEFNIAVFQKKAKAIINQIYEKGKIPILVGGTGFYINAIVYDNNFMETNAEETYRRQLAKLAEERGALYLHNQLKEWDPEAAEAIHPNNIKRVIRALEFFKQTGQKISCHNAEEKKRTSPYNTALIILTMERKLLYERINKRVDLMMQAGLLEEIKKLSAMGYTENLTSMKAIGYKEFFPYLKGEETLESAVDHLKQATRHFAKRQLTWFKGQTDGLWLEVTNKTDTEILQEMLLYIKEVIE